MINTEVIRISSSLRKKSIVVVNYSITLRDASECLLLLNIKYLLNKMFFINSTVNQARGMEVTPHI